MKKFLLSIGILFAVFSAMSPAVTAEDAGSVSYSKEGIPVTDAGAGEHSALVVFTSDYTGNAVVVIAAYDSRGVLADVKLKLAPVTQGVTQQCMTSVSIPEDGSAQVLVLNPVTLKPLIEGGKLNPPPAAEPDTAALTIAGVTYYGAVNRESRTVVFDIPTQKRMNQELEDMAVSPDILAEHITALAPVFTFAGGVTYDTAARDFSDAQVYTFTDKSGNSTDYTVMVRESILQRSHQFSRGTGVLINPESSIGGSTEARHGAPQADGTGGGSGIWYLDGFSYAKDARDAYIIPYVMDEASCGHLEYYTDDRLSARALRVIKDKDGDFSLYSAGGFGEYQNISAARTDLKFKLESLDSGTMEIYFGKNLFSLTAEPFDEEYAKIMLNGINDACQIIQLGKWYDLTFINTSQDGCIAQGELYINGSFLGNFEMQEEYCFSLREQIRFAFAPEARGSLALDSWGVTYVREDLSGEIEKAFAAHVDRYDASILEWIGQMYDKDTGGFYYSMSARNTEGYLPDLESTKQIMQTIEGLDYGSADITDPDVLYTRDMQNRVVAWTQELQSNEDGYFYHPQWQGIVNPSRLGRDTTNALSILGRFGAEPLYPTANDRLAEQVSVDEISLASVVSGYPACLESESSYLAWLDSFDWIGNPYSAGHNVCSVVNQIKAAGYGDITIDYLLSKQNPNNGVWGEDDLYEKYPIRAAGAVMKISCALRDLGATEYPYADKAIKTIVPWILNDDEAQDATYLFNIWQSISNIKRCMGYDIPKEWTETVYRNLPEMIARTSEKNAVFREPDGAYSFYKGKTAASMFSCPVAVDSAMAESDANATVMCTIFLTANIRNVCELTDSYEFFSRVEFEKLKTTLQSAEPVVKTN